MDTTQTLARCGSLQRSNTCPKPKSYSMTQTLGSHHEVDPTLVPLSAQNSSQRNSLPRRFRNGQNNYLSWPILPPPNLMPPSLLLGMVMCINSHTSQELLLTLIFCCNHWKTSSNLDSSLLGLVRLLQMQLSVTCSLYLLVLADLGLSTSPPAPQANSPTLSRYPHPSLT